jgi:hypothetical protein
VTPRFARFDGITIRLLFDEHPPAHIHVAFQGHVYRFAIADGEQLDDDKPVAPPALRRRIRGWIAEHRAELLDEWAKWEALRDPERHRRDD